MDREVRNIVILLTLFVLPGCVGGCYGLSKVKVSEGYRDGTIRKISTTGVIWPTVEIEAVDHDRFSGTETFRYTVRDPEVAAKVRSITPGHVVRIHYDRMLLFWAPHGETTYFVTKVEIVE